MSGRKPKLVEAEDREEVDQPAGIPKPRLLNLKAIPKPRRKNILDAFCYIGGAEDGTDEEEFFRAAIINYINEVERQYHLQRIVRVQTELPIEG